MTSATDNRTTELLPCPFCGGEAELKHYQSGDWQVICYHADGCIMCESDFDNCYWENVQTLARQWNTRAIGRRPYELRITGDGSDWGEIMRDAYDDLMAAACESCTPEQMEQLADYTRAELGSGTCKNVAREWEKTSFAHAGTSFCCSECGAHYVDAECYYAGLADKDEEQIRTSFCPNCGRKVVGEC